ncbi:MAG: hypothetical protein ABIK62_04655 [candidate division WOR-3 bacterium]
MKRTILLLLTAIGLIAAQRLERSDAVRAELERTDQIIARARELVENSGNQPALRDLNLAIETQRKAWAAFDLGGLRAAEKLTLAARRLAQRAILLVRYNPDRINAEIERALELMREIGPRIERSRNPRAIELWRLAESEINSARQELRREHYLLALKFAAAARNHARMAIALVLGTADPERIRAELERTDDLIKRVQERLTAISSQQAQELLRRAEDWQQQARTALENQMPGQALRLTLAARDLLLRAWERGSGLVGQALVERALAETDQMIERWTDLIRRNDQPEPGQLLEQAIRNQTQAQAEFLARRFRPAYEATVRARRLMNRAIELVQPEEPGPDTESPDEQDR